MSSVIRSIRWIVRASTLTATALLFVALAARPCVATEWMRDTFRTTPFDARRPRWCERYHHGHYRDHSVRFVASEAADRECVVGRDVSAGLSCHEEGCDACAAAASSPCAKVGDPQGNAVIQTVRDFVGQRRSATATFVIERPLPVGGSHLGLYVAMHPHCHATVQAILVPDGLESYHLNLAVIHRYIGGDPTVLAECRARSFERISPPLQGTIALRTGRRYVWTLTASLDRSGRIVAASAVRDRTGAMLASGRYRFGDTAARSWFGVARRAARFAFGAQFSPALSPAGRRPVIRLLAFTGSARDSRPE